MTQLAAIESSVFLHVELVDDDDGYVEHLAGMWQFASEEDALACLEGLARDKFERLAEQHPEYRHSTVVTARLTSAPTLFGCAYEADGRVVTESGRSEA